MILSFKGLLYFLGISALLPTPLEAVDCAVEPVCRCEVLESLKLESDIVCTNEEHGRFGRGVSILGSNIDFDLNGFAIRWSSNDENVTNLGQGVVITDGDGDFVNFKLHGGTIDGFYTSVFAGPVSGVHVYDMEIKRFELRGIAALTKNTLFENNVFDGADGSGGIGAIYLNDNSGNGHIIRNNFFTDISIGILVENARRQFDICGNTIQGTRAADYDNSNTQNFKINCYQFPDGTNLGNGDGLNNTDEILQVPYCSSDCSIQACETCGGCRRQDFCSSFVNCGWNEALLECRELSNEEVCDATCMEEPPSKCSPFSSCSTCTEQECMETEGCVTTDFGCAVACTDATECKCKDPRACLDHDVDCKWDSKLEVCKKVPPTSKGSKSGSKSSKSSKSAKGDKSGSVSKEDSGKEMDASTP